MVTDLDNLRRNPMGQLMCDLDLKHCCKETPGEAVRNNYRNQGATAEQTRIIKIIEDTFKTMPATKHWLIKQITKDTEC